MKQTRLVKILAAGLACAAGLGYSAGTDHDYYDHDVTR